MRALITTVPFGAVDPRPIEMLVAAGIDYVVNPLNRRLQENELYDLVSDFDILIAGTEPITDKVINKASQLKLISRVGIGLDSVDLNACRMKGIKVSYTPDAPAPAVAEMSIGLMLTVARSLQVANLDMHNNKWQRYYGRRLSEMTIGVVGCGRIGSRVLNLLTPFQPRRILLNRIKNEVPLGGALDIELATKDSILAESDILTLHVPLTPKTKNWIDVADLTKMQDGSYLLNTSRGGIVNEIAVAEALRSGKLLGAAIDVFESEPYQGDLCDLPNCNLSCHMGSMSYDCRRRMEIEATEEAIRFAKGERLKSIVPNEEYETQKWR